MISKICTKERYQKVELQYYLPKELEEFLKKFKFLKEDLEELKSSSEPAKSSTMIQKNQIMKMFL